MKKPTQIFTSHCRRGWETSITFYDGSTETEVSKFPLKMSIKDTIRHIVGKTCEKYGIVVNSGDLAIIGLSGLWANVAHEQAF